MKFDQIVILIVFALLAAFVWQRIVDSYDELEFAYDPSTGAKSFRARKNRLLAEPSGMFLKGV